MTAINTLNPAVARARIDRIKVSVEATWHLIVEAYMARDWETLGYMSWDELCASEFGTSRLRLPREERAEVVSSLREQGLSLRAIASVTGDSLGTVQAEAATPQVFKSEHLIPDDLGTTDPIADGLSTAEVIDYDEAQEIADDDAIYSDAADALAAKDEQFSEQAKTAKPVTGIDGKQYAPKSDRTPARKPLSDSANSAGWELRKSMERIEKVFDDNRYRTNEKQIAAVLRGHLLYVAETVAAVLDQLPAD